jgi:TetR/AcrR family transcriptional regulator
MTTTPWGDSEELRDRKLQPGPGVPREDVERNQRERLFGATVAVVATKGYGPTTISDLIRVAGVSRTTFYRYFADKEACFLATLEILVADGVAVAKSRLGGEGELRGRAEEGLRAFAELLVSQPDAARICVVESEAAGPKAVAIVDAAAAEFAQMVSDAFEELPEQRGMPIEIVTAMVGGVRKLMQTRLRRRTEGELLEMVPDLVALGLSYRPPPAPLPDRPPRGEVAVTAERYRGVDEPAQRLELATMTVVARNGYAETTMAAIASEARVSLRTLYTNFKDKEDVFEAALLRGRLRMAAATIPAYRRAETWPESIAAIIRAGLAFLEAERDFAHLIAVDVHGAGAGPLESRDRSLERTRQFIEADPGYPEGDNPTTSEAIQSGLYGMLSTRVRSRRKNLQGLAPLAIYVILAPFVGPEDAYRHAVG